MLDRTFQSISSCLQLILISSIALLLMSAPVRAEMTGEEYIAIVSEAAQEKNLEKIIKLIQENPATTEMVIQRLEEAAVLSEGEEAEGIKAFASVLKEIRRDLNNNPVTNEPATGQEAQAEYSKAVKLFREGEARYSSWDYHGAIQSWESALKIAENLNQKQGVVAALGSLGNAYTALGDYRKSLDYLKKGLAIAEELQDKRLRMDLLGNLVIATISLGEYRQAIDYSEKGLLLAEELGDPKGKGIHLGNLGTVYNYLGEYRKAIEYNEKALAIAEAIGNTEGRQVRLGNLGDVYREFGDYPKAIEFQEKSLAIAVETGDKQGECKSLANLGNVYTEIGDYRKAMELHEKALATAEAIGDKHSRGSIFGNLGADSFRLGDFRKSIDYFQQALALLAEVGDEHGGGAALGNLGNVYRELGDYLKAIDYFEKALATAEALGDRKGIATWLGNLGTAYSNLGDYQKAIDYYGQALGITMEINYTIGFLNLQGNLGDAYLATDQDEEAFYNYNRLDNCIRLGRYHLKKKNFSEAARQFERDLEKDEKARSAGLAIAKWIGLGLANEGLHQYQEAYKWYQKAISFMEEQRAALSPTEREHYLEGTEFDIPRIEAYEGAARCAFMLNRPDEAFFWAENTRGRLTSELLSGRHAGNNAKIPADLAQEEEELATRIMLNKKQQQFAFAKDNQERLQQLEAEYPALRTRMDSLIDRLRQNHPQYAAIKYPQPVKLSQLALKPGETVIEYEVTGPYTIGLVIRDGKVVKSFKVDQTRKEIETLVKKIRAPFQDGADINDIRLQQATAFADLLLKPALAVVNKSERLIIIPDESLGLVPFEALLLAVPTAALKEEADLLAQASQQPTSLAADKATIIRGLAKAPATRSSGATIAPRVSTHILFDTGSANLRAESGQQLREILAALGSQELQGATIRLEGHTDSVGRPDFNLRLSQRRARAVYDYLVDNSIKAERLSVTGKGDTEPVADNGDEPGRSRNRRVDLIRIDSNFAAPKAAAATGLVYAMDEYPISYYQSASVLTLQRGLKVKRTEGQKFFGLGDPVYDSGDTRATGLRGIKIVAKGPATADDIANLEETKEAGYQFNRLINTEREIKEVGRLFTTTRLLTGVEASEAKLKAEELSIYKYLLFSTHGILGNEIPYVKQPALVLNQIGNDLEDGFMTASEIFNLNLNAEVVALSACKTGLGVQSAGEGVVGLSRAFMYAGTDTVLVSLWSVADESTYKLMVKFFEGVEKGQDKITALQEAKNHLRTNGYTNPFYWAPFILVGEAD